MMTILFPSDYFEVKKVDEPFQPEYNEAAKLPEFRLALYNHDAFIEGEPLKLFPQIEPGLCIARTWMLKPHEYRRLYAGLSLRNVHLINTPEEYERFHLFPNIYPSIASATPKALVFSDPARIDVSKVNSTFARFMMKDYVKSVKGFDFPQFFETPVTEEQVAEQVARFIELRDNLFTGGIVLKEFVELKRYRTTTNEYRAFYLNGHVLTVSKNSNQPTDAALLPESLALEYKDLPSHYYTVDFGELSTGGFVILETGDGQVSGLSPNQYIFKYYDEMRYMLSE